MAKKNMSLGRKFSRGFLPGPLGTIMEVMVYFTIMAQALNMGYTVFRYQTSRDVLIPVEAAVVQDYSPSRYATAEEIATMVGSEYQKSQDDIKEANLDKIVGADELEKIMEHTAPYVASALGISQVSIPNVEQAEGSNGTYYPRGNKYIFDGADRRVANSHAANTLIPSQWMTESNWSVLKRVWNNTGDEGVIASSKFYNELFVKVAGLETVSRMALDGDEFARNNALLILNNWFGDLVANGYDGSLREGATLNEIAAVVVMQAYNGDRETLRGMQLDGSSRLIDSLRAQGSFNIDGKEYIIDVPS